MLRASKCEATIFLDILDFTSNSFPSQITCGVVRDEALFFLSQPSFAIGRNFYFPYKFESQPPPVVIDSFHRVQRHRGDPHYPPYLMHRFLGHMGMTSLFSNAKVKNKSFRASMQSVHSFSMSYKLITSGLLCYANQSNFLRSFFALMHGIGVLQSAIGGQKYA